jgi:hypothetical protein
MSSARCQQAYFNKARTSSPLLSNGKSCACANEPGKTPEGHITSADSTVRVYDTLIAISQAQRRKHSKIQLISSWSPPILYFYGEENKNKKIKTSLFTCTVFVYPYQGANMQYPRIPPLILQRV